MPIFDYHCSECGLTYEIFHKVREKTEDIVCPKCGSTHSKKQMAAPAVSMGGSSSSESGSQNFGGGCASGMCGLN
jgi:putative FmdB family regulatory protein